MMTVYIKGKSKAAINRSLQAGEPVNAIQYDRCSVTTHKFQNLPDGTVVKVFEKIIGGSPYAKSYGTVKNGKLS